MAATRKTSNARITLTRRNSVYDVTEFAARHPGGQDLLEKFNGQEVAAVMRDPGVHQHSKAAYTIMETYLVEDGQSRAQEKADQARKAQEFEGGLVSEDFDGCVDWSRPLLGQVGNLGDRYFEWTHQQVDRPIRLFHWDLVEMLTRAYWWMVPLMWCPVIAFMVTSSYSHLVAEPESWPSNSLLTRQYGPGSIPSLLAVGGLFWTLLEYVIHRWLFHLQPPASSRLLILLHFLFHGQHHKSPMDPMRLVFPPVPASLFAVSFHLMTGLVFPTGMARSVFAGIVAGYVTYDLTHYYLHHGGVPAIRYFRRLKTYHSLHHYRHQQLGFGISSSMWDYPFCTRIPEDSLSQKLE
ncbi:fatty acid 2-hydroxylase [Elysia marginata]|uniref:Fatty acid 2-hydroxylase n=1 Tax=Elysia marginata TaxID=1093978 RepID=A0AAV4FGK0_9GAST|nr:fatty acid 2-hydroxylase [Elysia marginata]